LKFNRFGAICPLHLHGQRMSEARKQHKPGSKQSSSTLNMEATCSSETSVDFQWTTRHYIPQDRTFHSHRCENLKS
jgi:hypothetical protein